MNAHHLPCRHTPRPPGQRGRAVLTLGSQLAADKQLKDWMGVFHETLDGIQYNNTGFSKTTPTVKTDKSLLSGLVVEELTKDSAMEKDINTFKAIFSTLKSLPSTNTACSQDFPWEDLRLVFSQHH